MKMNGNPEHSSNKSSWIYWRSVDFDLSQIIQQWVERSNLTEKSPDKAEETWLALGYTRTLANSEALSQLDFEIPEAEIEKPACGVLLNQNIFERF